MKTLILMALLLASALPLRAQLVFDTDRVVVPVGLQEGKITGRFGFHNAGKTQVEIVTLSTSCGCTTATLEPRVFAPGAHGEIVATMTLDRYLGQEAPAKKIVVKTGDDDPQTIVLTLVAQWPEVVKVTPPFTTWKMGEPPTPHRLLLVVQPGQEIHFKSLKVYGDNFKAEVHELEPGRRYEVMITPTSTATFGETATIDVNGDYPADNPIPVRAYAYITP